MNLNDLPSGFADPIDDLFGFHRRIERRLAELASLGSRLDDRGIDAEAVAIAASLVDFFSRAVDLHHADEHDLLRALASSRRMHGARGHVESLREQLEADHREMGRTWRSLARSLRGVSEGANRTLSGDLVRYYRKLNAVHMCVEESTLHAVACALSPGERASLARGMEARRTRSFRFQ